MKCDHCPLKAGRCVGEDATADSFSWACPSAARGESLDAIRAVSNATDGEPSEPVPSYPPLATQAAAFLGAVASHVLAGMPNVDDAEYARRRSICRVCPEHVETADRCRKCGCGLSLKARWSGQRCPLGKWEEQGGDVPEDRLSHPLLPDPSGPHPEGVVSYGDPHLEAV